MSDKKVSQTDYSTIQKRRQPSTAMDSDSLDVSAPTKKKRESGSLQLDITNHRPTKTRTALYNELSKNDKVKDDEDYYEFSSPVARLIALAIDSVFAFALVKSAIFLSPLEGKFLHAVFLDKYKLQFMFGENLTNQFFLVATIFFALFFFIVIPVAFFNVSLGKKMTRQRVRGEGKYTITISQAFRRELIYKPISIVILIGFVLPFFDKKKKSLHDKLAGTFVIKE